MDGVKVGKYNEWIVVLDRMKIREEDGTEESGL